MAVILYWKERLEARCPLRAEAFKLLGFNYKNREADPTWYRAVAKQALFDDYQKWHEEVYLPPWRETGYYRDMPDQLPKAANSLEFFNTMAPFVYVIDHQKQTRSYPIKKNVLHNGEWTEVRGLRNFVRLGEWIEHIAAFELTTGMRATTSQFFYDDVARMGIMSQGQRLFRVRQEAMRKTDAS